jgi:hypothetical protein
MTPDVDLGRRRTVGDILGEAFRLFGAHAGVLLTATLAVVAPVTILVDGVLGGQLADGADADPGAAVALASTLLLVLVVPSLVTAIIVRTLTRLARGEDVSAGQALRDGAAAFRLAFAATLLVALVVAFGLVLLIIPGIYLGVRLYFAPAVSVHDEVGAIEALDRSGELVRDRWWRVFGVLLLTGLLIGLLGGIVGGIAAAALDNGVAYVVITTLVQTVTTALSALCGTLLFFDQRLDKGLVNPGAGTTPAAPTGWIPPTS